MPPKSSKYSTLNTMKTEMTIKVPKVSKVSKVSKKNQEEPEQHEKPKITRKRFSPSKTESETEFIPSGSERHKTESKTQPKVKAPHLVKGSEEARKRMSELRAMRGKKKIESTQ